MDFLKKALAEVLIEAEAAKLETAKNLKEWHDGIDSQGVLIVPADKTKSGVEEQLRFTVMNHEIIEVLREGVRVATESGDDALAIKIKALEPTIVWG